MERITTKEWKLTPVFQTNRFKGYLDKLIVEQKRVNPVHEIVNTFFQLRNLDKQPKEFYRGRWAYGKLSREAKKLLTECGNNLEDAMWAIDKMNYIATKKKFDWSISTCLNYDLIGN